MRASFRLAVLAVLVAAALAAGLVLLLGMTSLAADERYYAPQVRLFVDGRTELAPGITMLPGYHATLGLLLAVLGGYSDILARLVNLAVGLALLPLAWRLAAIHDPRGAPMKAAQAFLQPLFFPYLFLIYTEAWSLAVLAAMLLAVMARRCWLAAAFGLAGTVMRQDFIFWVAFAWLIAALEGIEPGRWREQAGAIARNAFVRAAPLVLVGIAFVAFVIWNGSIAVADRAVHAAPFNLANLWFFLLCAWLVFLPQCVRALPVIGQWLRRPAVALAIVAGFAAYMATWSNPHPYNQEHLRFWLHNEVLYWIDRNVAVRALLYVPMAWSALALASMRLPEWRLNALHVFAPLAAILHPLVEQRYYLPAMLLYVVWRARDAEDRWEWATLAAYLPAGLFLLWGIQAGVFFP